MKNQSKGKKALNLFSQKTRGLLIAGMFCISLISTAYPQGIVTGGTYKIIARHSGKVLEVLNGGTANGTNVQQAAFTDSAYQKWVITDVGGGYWKMCPMHRTNAALRKSASNVEMRSYTDEDTRHWGLVDVGDGYFQIMAKGLNQCVTIAAGSTDDGANAAVVDADVSLKYQHFRFESTTGGTPTLSVDPLILPLGFSGVSTPSVEQTYTIKGTSLSPESGDITITAPSPFEISVTSGSGFAPSATVPYTGGTLATKTVYVRFTPSAIESYSGLISNSGGGAAKLDVAVNGKGADYSSPKLIVSKTSLPVGYVLVNKPSREMAYTITGYGLTPASGNITITAPLGFEVSKNSGTGFASSLTLPYAGGGLLETSIFARLIPTEIKSYSGNITNTGGGISTLDIAVSGTGVNLPQAGRPVGFGQHTTGGHGGTIVTVATYEELEDYASREGAYIIMVKDTIEKTDGGMMDVTSNKSIIGIGANATIKGFGLKMGLQTDDYVTSPPENRIKNVIIQNLTFTDSPDDNINATMFTENIWIDHCAFYTQADGAIDIIRGCDWATISWCHFVGCAKTSLIGSNDFNEHQSAGRLHTTYHNNSFWYTKSRNPRARYGKVHCFNNQIFRMGDYGIGVGHKGNLFIENQYFWRAGDAWQLMYEGGHEGILTNAGWVRETGNIYDTDCGRHPTVMPPDSALWHPLEFYYYEAKSAEWVRDTLCVTDISDINNPKILSQLTGPKAGISTGIEDVILPAGKGFSFTQNYPNPFNEATTLKYNLFKPENVLIKIYDYTGKELGTLENAFQTVGQHEVIWQPKGLSNGIYFIRLQVGDNSETMKIILQN
ncbi:MAG: RICIN domain-containing protein [Bacteroidales bacterium]